MTSRTVKIIRSCITSSEKQACVNDHRIEMISTILTLDTRCRQCMPAKLVLGSQRYTARD